MVPSKAIKQTSNVDSEGAQLLMFSYPSRYKLRVCAFNLYCCTWAMLATLILFFAEDAVSHVAMTKITALVFISVGPIVETALCLSDWTGPYWRNNP